MSKTKIYFGTGEGYYSMSVFRRVLCSKFPELKTAELSVGISGDNYDFLQIESDHITLQWDITGLDWLDIYSEVLNTLRRYFHEQK